MNLTNLFAQKLMRIKKRGGLRGTSPLLEDLKLSKVFARPHLGSACLVKENYRCQIQLTYLSITIFIEEVDKN